MSIRAILNCTAAVVASCAMLSASWIPASAMTLAAPSPAQHFASSQIEKVWCNWGCGWGWHGGWGPAVAGGVVAGAAVGAAVAASNPYPYAYPYPYPYPYSGPCWRRAHDPEGRPYWRQVC